MVISIETTCGRLTQLLRDQRKRTISKHALTNEVGCLRQRKAEDSLDNIDDQIKKVNLYFQKCADAHAAYHNNLTSDEDIENSYINILFFRIRQVYKDGGRPQSWK